MPICSNVISTCISRHKYDCHLCLYDIYSQHGNHGAGYTSQFFLAYKAIIQQPPVFFTANCDRAFRETCHEEKSTDRPELKAYDAFFNMIWHWNPEQALENLAGAVFLLGCLQENGYFKGIVLETELESFRDERRHKLVFFDFLLFHFHAVILSNCHSVQGMFDFTRNTCFSAICLLFVCYFVLAGIKHIPSSIRNK